MENNYIVIGDSITYGIGDFKSGGWSAMFKNYIVNKDDSKVCNNYVHVAAFPGATSTDILTKIEYIFNSFRHDEFKNIVILSLGVNDTQEFYGNNKNSLEQYIKNIKQITEYIRTQKSDLIIMGLTRIESNEKFFWKPNKYYNNKEISKYDSQLEVFCKDNKITYIPMLDVLKDDFIDGIHPNQRGHKKIFERIVDNI